MEAERARQAQHEPRINPAELTGPPTYEEAVEMPRLARSLDNLNDASEGLGQSQQSLAQDAWERKKRMQSRKRGPKRARSENDLSSRSEGRNRKSERVKTERSTSAPRSAFSKSVVDPKNGKKEPLKKESDSEEPTSDVDDIWNRNRSRTVINRKKKRLLKKRDGHSSDDEESDVETHLMTGERRRRVGRIEVIVLPREPRSGTYRPPSLVSSPEPSDPLDHISRSKIV